MSVFFLGFLSLAELRVRQDILLPRPLPCHQMNRMGLSIGTGRGGEKTGRCTVSRDSFHYPLRADFMAYQGPSSLTSHFKRSS